MAMNKPQESKLYTFKMNSIKNEEISEKLADTLRDIDVILDKLQVNLLAQKSLFIEGTTNPKANTILGVISRILVDPVHVDEVTFNVQVSNKQIIETLDRELSIDEDNYRVEVTFINDDKGLKVLMFKLNTKANIDSRRKAKHNKQASKGKRRLFTKK